jgi:hypothetical protein
VVEVLQKRQCPDEILFDRAVLDLFPIGCQFPAGRIEAPARGQPPVNPLRGEVAVRLRRVRYGSQGSQAEGHEPEEHARTSLEKSNTIFEFSR